MSKRSLSPSNKTQAHKCRIQSHAVDQVQALHASDPYLTSDFLYRQLQNVNFSNLDFHAYQTTYIPKLEPLHLPPSDSCSNFGPDDEPRLTKLLHPLPEEETVSIAFN